MRNFVALKNRAQRRLQEMGGGMQASGLFGMIRQTALKTLFRAGMPSLSILMPKLEWAGYLSEAASKRGG